MSLLDEFSEEFCFMDSSHVADPEGGTVTTWTEGAKFTMPMRHDTSMQALRAEAEGVKSTYTFLPPKGTVLKFPDVVKRLSDGQVFRITSNANDSFTPGSSALNLTSVTAEKWSLST